MESTENCIVCFKKAVAFTGHVHTKDNDYIIAGWCEDHREFQQEHTPIIKNRNCVGCFGEYKEEMNIVPFNGD